MKNKKYGIFHKGLKKRTTSSEEYNSHYEMIDLASVEDGSVNETKNNSSAGSEDKYSFENKKESTGKPLVLQIRDCILNIFLKKNDRKKSFTNTRGNIRNKSYSGNDGVKAKYFLIPMFFLILVGGIYIYRLSSAPALKETDLTNQKNSWNGMVYEYGPLHPYEMCSMRKPDLIAHLGEPMGEGDGTEEETRFLRYEYEWFSLPTRSKIYYAREQRIYKAVITFRDIEFDDLQKRITDGVGEPVSVEESHEFKDVIWMKDSIKYWLTKTEEGELNLEVRLAYYENPEDLDLGYRPTIVQRSKTTDVTGDNKPDDVILIGSKRAYTQISYDHLYLLIISNGEIYTEDFPKDMDGGQYPQMRIETEKNKNEIVVESGNNFVLNQNVFVFENNKIKNISSTNEPIKK
ncbi:MAG: hypothetical protein ACTTKQ_04245 [Filifactor alocis]|uniref:hypothetical protein n=1 Tax=Filifactor alocis TaxID=143361 RepID=UPI0001CB7B7C